MMTDKALAQLRGDLTKAKNHLAFLGYVRSTCNFSQIPPDLVVKFQTVDIAEVI